MIEKYLNKVIHGDCLEILKRIPDQSVDLILTDPPYNISREKGDIACNGTFKRMDFGEWDYTFNPIPFLQESKRILKENGSILVWTSAQLFGDIYYRWAKENMIAKNLLVWVKTNPLPVFRKVNYRHAVEYIFWISKNILDKENPNFNFLFQENMKNYFITPLVMGKDRFHPCQKPLSIHEKLIRIHCRFKGIVLDPFAGSGTTLVAAKKLNRFYIGIEQDEKYYEICKKRLAGISIDLFECDNKNKDVNKDMKNLKSYLQEELF